MVQYLKAHYRFRKRSSETIAAMDFAHPSGLLADVHLTFNKENGSPFLATVEATSADKAHEVRFVEQKSLLFWDAFAGSTLFSFVVLFILVTQGVWLSDTASVLFNITFPIALAFLVFVFIIMALKTHSRYRYIYAVQQFTRYHADDQWIALGSDVFVDEQDPYFVELKAQCIARGIGLVVVDAEEHIDILVSPAVSSLIATDRPALVFEAAPMVGIQPHILRFQTGTRPQMLLSMVGMIGILFCFYYARPEAAYAEISSERAYRDSMALQAELLAPESTDPTPREVQMAPSRSDSPTRFVSNNSDMAPPPQDLYLTASGSAPGYESHVWYDCSRVVNGREPLFFVQESTWATKEAALRRLQFLYNLGIHSQLMRVGCLENSSASGYIVVLNSFQNTRAAAREVLDKLKIELENKNLPTDNLRLRSTE